MQFLSYDGQCLIYWHACEQGGYIIRYQLLARRHIEILQCVSELFAVLDAVDCFALKWSKDLRDVFSCVVSYAATT